MYELIQVTESAYYIQCPAKIGLVRTAPDRAVLIDSGSDRDAGKKAKKILDANGWKLEAIYNTHSHADHIGGNEYLQRQTGCRIYAFGIERDFTEHPVLEPAFLYGGNPPGELRHKFLMAQPSEVQTLSWGSRPRSEDLEVVWLPGHSWDMSGYRTADGALYLADCLSSAETLEKYRISFLVDPGAYLNTLEIVKKMEAKVFIPSHAEATNDIVPLADLNIRAVNEIADSIAEICQTPASFESLLAALFRRYDLTMTFEQHALVGSTVRSYLTWMKDSGRVFAFFEDNVLLWQTK